MPGVFISYRREDSAGHTGRLFDRLRASLGDDRVFMDITGIEAGVDFVDTIERAIGSCDVLLAVIGPEWLSCADENGRRRLEDPSDLIRLEIAAALRRNVRVIPVLIAGASMPAARSLPDDLKPLARRQAAELRDTRWDVDTGDLIAILERVPSASSSSPPEGSAPLARDSGARDRRSFYPWVTAALGLPTLSVVVILLNSSPLGPNGSMNPLASNTSRSSTEQEPELEPEHGTPTRPEVLDGSGGAPRSSAESVSHSHSDVEDAAASNGRDATKKTRVPRVEGLTLSKATQALRDAGLTVGIQQGVPAPGVSPLVVTRQIPTAGSFVPRDGRVHLLYAGSGAPLLVTVPNIVGVDLMAASSTLRELGLVVRSRQYRTTVQVPAGQIVSRRSEAGSIGRERQWRCCRVREQARAQGPECTAQVGAGSANHTRALRLCHANQIRSVGLGEGRYGHPTAPATRFHERDRHTGGRARGRAVAGLGGGSRDLLQHRRRAGDRGEPDDVPRRIQARQLSNCPSQGGNLVSGQRPLRAPGIRATGAVARIPGATLVVENIQAAGDVGAPPRTPGRRRPHHHPLTWPELTSTQICSDDSTTTGRANSRCELAAPPLITS